MISFADFGRWTVTAALAFFGVACVVESHDCSQVYQTGGGATGGGGQAGAGATGGQAQQPVLVVVDADKTMSADPGQGVGVFTEYASGGHWHVWLSCDTVQTGQNCAFDVSVHVESGAAANVNLTTNATFSGTNDASNIEATATLTNDLASVDFDTDAGATVQLTATIGGSSDPSFFFFVQDGKVNGGYDGHLTNPLRFQGNKP